MTVKVSFVNGNGVVATTGKGNICDGTDCAGCWMENGRTDCCETNTSLCGMCGNGSRSCLTCFGGNIAAVSTWGTHISLLEAWSREQIDPLGQIMFYLTRISIFYTCWIYLNIKYFIFTLQANTMPVSNLTLSGGKHIGLHVGQFVATAQTIPNGQLTIFWKKKNNLNFYHLSSY